MPGPSGLPSGRILLSWFNKNPPPVSSSLVIHWPPHSGLVCKPQHPLFVKSWYPVPQWPQLRQHPVAHGPNLYTSEHAWPFSLQVSIVLVCLLACFYCNLLDSGLYHQITKYRLWAGIFLPWNHELIWPALHSANICGSLRTLLHHLLSKKIKTNVTLGSTLSLPSVTSITESVFFCQFKANAFHAF